MPQEVMTLRTRNMVKEDLPPRGRVEVALHQRDIEQALVTKTTNDNVPRSNNGKRRHTKHPHRNTTEMQW